MDQKNRRMFTSYFLATFTAVVLTVLFFFFMYFTIFPKHTINENGDIIVEVYGLVVNHIEIQQFETNVETLETKLTYLYEPVEFGDSEIRINNADVSYLNNVLFSDGDEYNITFGEVIAYPRLGALFIIGILYVVITMYFVPYAFWKFT